MTTPTNSNPTGSAIAQCIEAFIIVFGLIIGSGFDGLSMGGFADKMLYAIALSVVARFTLGSVLHLHIEHLRAESNLEPIKKQRRRALLVDVSFLVLFGLVLRFSGSPVPLVFFLYQTITFALAVIWGVVSPVFHPTPNGEWGFWRTIDILNLLVAAGAAIALCALPPEVTLPVLHLAVPRSELVIMVAAAGYTALFGWDVALLLRCADGTEKGASASWASRLWQPASKQ